MEETVQQIAARKPRLHHLDWLRGLMVFFVVFAHIATNNQNGILPDYGLAWDNHDFTDKPNTIAVRLVSFIRPWCLPLLFFVSGAATACSYKNGINLRALATLALFTLLGVASNTVLWLLGPQDSACGVKDKCTKGILFHFTFCPGLGDIFPLIFQMWYTLVLMFFIVANSPLCAIASGHLKKPWHAVAHVVFWVGFQCLLVHSLGDTCEEPFRAGSLLAICELGFVGLVWMTTCPTRPAWLPLRAVHYALGLVMAIQYALPPLYTSNWTDGSLNAGWIVATFVVVFNKSFAMGFVLTWPRTELFSNPKDDKVQPLLSRYWPAVVFPLALFSQSTNFALAGGNLTYPYYHRMQDRFSYVAYALIILFALDRLSRWGNCEPMPPVLTWTSLFLYLLHPLVCSFLIVAGISEVFDLWLLSAAIVLIIVGISMFLRSSISQRRSAFAGVNVALSMESQRSGTA